MQTIEQAVRQFFIENFFIEAGNGQLSDDDSFLESGVLDSMGVLTLVEFVSEKYGIKIDDEELVPENWDSIRRVADFVRSKSQVEARPRSSSEDKKNAIEALGEPNVRVSIA
jgi:acyl carrier protein